MQLSNVKPNTLAQRRRRLVKPRAVGPRRGSFDVFLSTTRGQLERISEEGGVIALSWTGGRRVSIVPFPQGPLTLSGDGVVSDGWQDWMLKIVPEHGCNLVDLWFRIARDLSQYNFHVDSLPDGVQPIHDAWKHDVLAQAAADKLWSSVTAFNFGAPGFFDRYVAMSDDDRVKFAESGYKPQLVELREKQAV